MILSSFLDSYKEQIPSKDLRLIAQYVLNISDQDWIISKDKQISENEKQFLELVLQKRISGIPCARLFQQWEFWGMDFSLSKDTLVPRPDTETLIEAVLKTQNTTSPKQILDLGTGSGCILISLLSEYPEAFGVGVDISKDALRTAKKNAVRHNVFKRSEFLQADWSTPLQSTFDVIVSNPPYIETSVIESLEVEVKDHDPILALDGGEDGLDSIKILLGKIKNCVANNTSIFFEIGYNQADSVMKLIEKNGFSTKDVHKDLSGHDRVIEFAYGDKK